MMQGGCWKSSNIFKKANENKSEALQIDRVQQSALLAEISSIKALEVFQGSSPTFV